MRKKYLFIGLDHIDSRQGGLGRAFDSICAEFTSNGYSLNRLETGLKFHGKQVTPTSPSLTRLFWLVKSALKVRKNTSLIYSHFALHGLIVSFFVRAPIFSFFHGPWANESKIASKKNVLKFQIQKIIEKSTYKKSTHIHCASTSFKRILVEEYGVNEDKVSVIPLGVDLEKFSYRDKKAARKILGLSESEIVYISVRRLTARMGLNTLIKCFSNFLLQQPNAKLFIIGKGKQKNKLIELIRSLNLNDSIQILENISDSELSTWYSAADLSIIPSLELEGFGLVALESLSCGTPVLASKCGGLEEIINRWNPQFLFNPYDANELEIKMAEFAKGDILITRQNCREFASKYTWAKCFSLIKKNFDKKRILFFNAESVISGAELSLLGLIKRLKSNFETKVVIGGNGPLYNKFVEADLHVQKMPQLSLEFSRYDSKFVLLNVALKLPKIWILTFREFVRQVPDIVYINTFKTLISTLPIALFCRRTRIIYWAHDSFEFDSKSKFLKKSLFRLFFRFSKIEVVCNSFYTSQTLLKTFDLQSAHILYPIVEPSEIVLRRSHSEIFRFGICGRIADWKGQLFALQALEKLIFASTNVYFEILGSPQFGDNDYLKKIYDFIEEKDLVDKVHIIPFCDRPEVVVVNWDLSLHTSLIPEPFGRTIVESLRLGVPVVVPQSGGPLEIVDNEITGLFYEMGDAQDLYQKVAVLMKNPHLLAKLRQNCGKSFLKFDIHSQIIDFDLFLTGDSK